MIKLPRKNYFDPIPIYVSPEEPLVLTYEELRVRRYHIIDPAWPIAKQPCSGCYEETNEHELVEGYGGRKYCPKCK